MITRTRSPSCTSRETISGSLRSYAITSTRACLSAIASSSTSRIALRASNPIQLSASPASGWVGVNARPVSALSGSSVEMSPSGAKRSTNACEETKPRVNDTLSLRGYVSRRSSRLASCSSP